MQSYLFFLLFFLSGIAGLIYETIWSQYLKLFLGHAAWSQTLVLIIYMGGMAAGAWIAGKRLKNQRKPLYGYAVIEIVLGCCALLFHSVFLAYQDLSYAHIFPLLNRSFPISLWKWITASLMILPQSILLGATFPLMVAGYLRRFPGTDGRTIAVLYFCNTFGASAGVLLSGFYLVGKVGLRGTVSTAGIIDIIVGLTVMWLFRIRKEPAMNPDSPPSAAPVQTGMMPVNSGVPPDMRLQLLAVSGITAAASFMYEIGWIRMLSLVLGSSTHSFELMLSTFIFGMAAGSFAIRKKIDRIVSVPRTLVLVQVTMGITALLSVFTYSRMFHLMQFIITSLGKNEQGYLLFNLFSDLICMLVMLPSTVCAGMVLPLIIHLFYRQGHGETSIGKVYAINTFGGIVGIILSVGLLMPLTGVRLLVTTGALIDIGIGIYILLKFREFSGSRLKQFLPASCALIFIVSVSLGRVDPELSASGVFRNGTIAQNIRILTHKDGRTATITLYRNHDNLVLCTNGKPDAAVNVRGGICGDEYTMSLIAALPMATLGNQYNAAVIGMGCGMTAHSFLHDSLLTHMDVVEIEPAMIDGARRIGSKVDNTFTDARSHIHIDDAKTFFSARNRTYDVVVSEPSNPWVSGVSGLFSKEFFRRIRHHLDSSGILVQWFHRYESDISILVSILRAMREHFPRYELYATGSDLMILASANSSSGFELNRDIFRIKPLAEQFTGMKLTSLDDLRALHYASEKTLDCLVDCYDVPANSDYYPYVDLNAVKYRFIDEYIRQLDSVYNYIIPLCKIIEADTSYILFTPRDTLPDISNFHSFVEAKRLYRELMADNALLDSLLEDLTTDAMLVDYASFAPHKVNFNTFFSVIVGILEKTLPYLSASEMSDIWLITEAKLNEIPVTKDEKIWMEYFSALCRYDMQKMHTLSSRLLPVKGAIEDDYINRMLITSLILSSSRSDQKVTAENIYDRFVARKNPCIMIRLARKWVYR